MRNRRHLDIKVAVMMAMMMMVLNIGPELKMIKMLLDGPMHARYLNRYFHLGLVSVQSLRRNIHKMTIILVNVLRIQIEGVFPPNGEQQRNM